jgi:hypothetical protein
MLKGLFPVRFVQLLGGVDDVVTVVFRGQLESFRVILLNQLLEVLAYDLLVYKELVLSNVGNLKEHSCEHIYALEKLEVNVHVEWNLTLNLFLFKLNRLVWLSADALSKDLSKSRSTLYVNKDIMAVLNHAKAESCNADLGHSAIVENLGPNILKVNAFTYVSLKDQISSFEESAVDTVVIGLLEGSAYLHL